MKIDDSIMEVRGSAVQTVPIALVQKFGKNALNTWLESLSSEARLIYGSPINDKSWYPLKQILIEPMASIAQLFYNNDYKKAGWEFGNYSVELGVKGLKKLIFKIITPGIIISKAVDILPTYYRPCKLKTVKNMKGSAIFQIINFPDIDETTEYRIAGWMFGALKINNVNKPKVEITQFLSKKQAYTEYHLNWIP